MAGAREGRERADEIAIEPPQVRIAMGAIERRVEARDRTALGVAVVDEATNVGVGAMDLIVAVLDESRVDVTVRELLDERRREPDRDLVRDPALPKVVEKAEQRKVRTEDRLVHPFLAVRPAARAASVRQMRVEDEREGLGHSPIVAVGGALVSPGATRPGNDHRFKVSSLRKGTRES